jgi:hypothetical protein
MKRAAPVRGFLRGEVLLTLQRTKRSRVKKSME